jgi:hypothetical protein
MMNMKRLCSTFTLTLILATSALAGGMECPIVEPTPTAAPTTLCGGIECPPAQPAPDATTTQGSDVAAAAVAEAALSLVGSVVALF